MSRRRRMMITSAFALAAAACTNSDATAPRSSGLLDNRTYSGAWHDGAHVPGSAGHAGSTAAQSQALQCSVPAPLTGSARIGPSGGVLDVGPHRLIIPAGALTHDVDVRGEVPAGNTMQIQFYPEGLQFKKPAGLILDASSCNGVPDVLYMNEQGGSNEIIEAIFSEWWHAIAAPIDHFSLYVLMV